MAGIQAVNNFEILKDKEVKFIKKHHLVAPVVSSAAMAGVGAGLGYLIPFNEDVFIQSALINEADKCLKDVHVSIGTEETKKAEEALVRFRRIAGNEAFERLVNADFREDSLADLAKSLTDLEVENAKKEYEKELAKDFKKFLKKEPEALNKYAELIKKMHAANMKNVALVFGVSTLVITGVYSLIHYRANKKYLPKN